MLLFFMGETCSIGNYELTNVFNTNYIATTYKLKGQWNLINYVGELEHLLLN